MNFSIPFERLEKGFKSFKISPLSPAFYDHSNFIRAEQQDPTLLDAYASYVLQRPRSEDYERHVREVVPEIARVFHKSLIENGRLGACVDISGLILRTLEAEGVWAYMTKGSLTISYPENSGISNDYFYSIDQGEFTAGHSWVVAPPFDIIDVSVQLQPGGYKGIEFLPEIVCVEGAAIATAEVNDIVAPEIIHYLTAHGVPTTKQLEVVSPGTRKFLKIFHPKVVVHIGSHLKYVHVANTAPDAPFDQMTAMKFFGKTGFELYCEEIEPMLRASNFRTDGRA